MSLRNMLLTACLAGSTMAGCSDSPTQATGTVTVTRAVTPPIIEPLVGSATTSPGGIGIASATLYTLTVAPSGGVPPYTVSWNFGDGGASAGATVQHVYASTGTFTAIATLTDSKGTVSESSTIVSIRSVTGRWLAIADDAPDESLDIVQIEGAVTAAINDMGPLGFGLGTGTGSVSNPRSLSVSVAFTAPIVPPLLPGATPPATPPVPLPPFAVTYIGTLDETLTKWNGRVSGYPDCTTCSFTATRLVGDLSAGRR